MIERSEPMSTILRKGVIRGGQVILEEPINLPDGSEVTIMGQAYGKFVGQEDNDRPPTPEEIAAALAAMDQIEPFEMTDEERAAEAAFEYGRIAAELRRLGRMIGQNDIMIAAVAMTLGNSTVVTMDNDYANVPGLTVENWAEPEGGAT
jgi:predicted nucleic acid-binding protein